MNQPYLYISRSKRRLSNCIEIKMISFIHSHSEEIIRASPHIKRIICSRSLQYAAVNWRRTKYAKRQTSTCVWLAGIQCLAPTLVGQHLGPVTWEENRREVSDEILVNRVGNAYGNGQFGDWPAQIIVVVFVSDFFPRCGRFGICRIW